MSSHIDRVPINLIEDAAHSLRSLIMFIEQKPKDSPLFFIGDSKPPVVELYDFQLAKKSLENLEKSLQIKTMNRA